METAEIRRRWLSYFSERGHAVVPSSSLISDDPTLLFTVAGMVPFIPYLTGQQTPPWQRATSVQKCVRTLDIEEVGKTTRHGTFFQMNGNFSFGDYFKEGAIEYAWELITNEQHNGGYGFDPDKIWVTVLEGDDEAERLWRKVAGLPAERIQRRGRKDNYWHTGVAGPGGPCSEIYVDRGAEYGPDGGPVVDEDRFLEIWNLVFMQEEVTDVRSKEEFEVVGPLPSRNIDTGMGLERVAYLLQGVDNLYEIDEVYPVIEKAAELSGRRYGADHDDDVRMRVVADHLRSGLMLIGDGITPGNEGRGYVLRRLLRRSVRAMKLLGVDAATLPELLPVSLERMTQSYPELEADFGRISAVAYAEEEAFRRTLASGTVMLDTAVRQVRSAAGEGGAATLQGEQAFQLHDTYGFPIDLTLEMAAEQGVAVDREGFTRLMTAQRERAKADARAKKGGRADTTAYRALRDAGATTFTGYTGLSTGTTVRGLLLDGEPVEAAQQGQVVEVVLEETPFYAESGGQDSDAGTITGHDGLRLDVLDVQRPVKGLVVHRVEVGAGEVRAGQEVLAQVDEQWRLGACQAHSGTHVVHASLREVLGPTALQSGSYNKPGYLRLDFAWPNALSPATRSEVEEVANLALRRDLPVSATYMTLPQARELGALALFGETYDEQVRVVEMGGEWSRELCGGTHVAHSSQVGLLALTGESSVGAGVRRVESLVGHRGVPVAGRRARAARGRGRRAQDPSRGAARPHRRAAVTAQGRREAAVRTGGPAGAGRGGLARAVAHRRVRRGLRRPRRRCGLVRRRRPRPRARRARAGWATPDRPWWPCPAWPRTARSSWSRPTPPPVSGAIKAGALVRVAAQTLGGGGGGKDDLAQGGGTDPAAVPAALRAVEHAVGETVTAGR